MSAQRKGGWGSLLGSAVAGLESRLDTILADDEQTSAKAKAAAEAAKQAEKQRLQVDQGGYMHCGAKLKC
jgi:outer membrane murein-binding lipoprotein Lpp